VNVEAEIGLQLSPAWCLRQGLEGLRERSTRLLLRAVLCASAGGIRVEGASRLAGIPDPAVFALSHHSAYEALLAPAALIALRGGRRVRFLVDWMYLELPLAGAILRHGEPIAVYRKPARWRWREHVRRQGLRSTSPADRALMALRRGISVGIYPEGRRNADPWRLAPMRRGAAVLATKAGAPLVPIGIDFPARERLGRVPRLGRMVLRVGEPLAPPPGDDLTAPSRAAALSRELQAALAGLARKSTLS
jgi:1-acyl-sn-glycerol-3-phosphate acyltransferase